MLRCAREPTSEDEEIVDKWFTDPTYNTVNTLVECILAHLALYFKSQKAASFLLRIADLSV